jgi:hypothetical protein
MFNIADYFKKFARIEGDSLVQKDAVAKALYETCKIEGASFEVKKGILYIKGSAMVKSLVYMKKEAILASLKLSLPQSNIYDVR